MATDNLIHHRFAAVPLPHRGRQWTVGLSLWHLNPPSSPERNAMGVCAPKRLPLWGSWQPKAD